jgi:ELWxxDGT repeat protein
MATCALSLVVPAGAWLAGCAGAGPGSTAGAGPAPGGAPSPKPQECQVTPGPLPAAGRVPADAVAYRVKDILPGYASSEPYYLTDLGGVALFRANDGATGIELWRSDGTAAGTRLVKDIVPGPAGSLPGAPPGSTPTGLRALDGRVLFPAYDEVAGGELWASDGTEAGTLRVKDIWPDAAGSHLSALTVAGRQLFFTANDGVVGEELWVSDGTPSGTHPVADLMPGATGSLPRLLTALGPRLFWVARRDGPTGSPGLWTTDGTAAGTRLVKSIGSSVWSMVAGGGLLYFAVDSVDASGIHYVLWTSDGTEAGTVPVAEPFAGLSATSATSLTPVGDMLFFRPSQGRGLWRSDGTPNGTFKVADRCESWLANIQGTLVCRDQGSGGASSAIWRSDGTAAGTCMVKDGFSLEGGKPWMPTGIGGRLLLRAGQEGAGSELWKSDGTSAGTSLAHDILAGPETSQPREMTVVGDRVFFAADDGVAGTELWAFGSPVPPEAAPPPRPAPRAGNRAPRVTKMNVHTPMAGEGPPLPFDYGRVECWVEDEDGDPVTATATLTNGGWGWIDWQTTTFVAGASLPANDLLFTTTLYTQRPTDARVTCRAFDSEGAEATPLWMDLAIR